MKYRPDTMYATGAIAGGILTGFLSGNPALGAAAFAILLLPAWWGTYVRYARDNPRGLWFKRKLYGWGWTPVTWQGWLVTLGYIATIGLLALNIREDSSWENVVLMFALPLAVFTGVFMGIALQKGERPRWQWGEDGRS